jgi:hypothetical protein
MNSLWNGLEPSDYPFSPYLFALTKPKKGLDFRESSGERRPHETLWCSGKAKEDT